MSDRYIAKALAHDEEVVFVTRQHRLVLFGQIISEAVLALTVIALVTYAWRRWDPHPLFPLAYLVLIFPLVSLAVDVLRWGKHQYVVTNRRVLEARGILNKEVTDSSLEKINDVKLTQPLLGRMFDFGNLEILTASESGLSRFRNVNHPIRLKTAMLDAKQRMGRDEWNGREAVSSEGEILGLLSHVDKLHEHGALTDAEADQIKATLLSRLPAKA
jgi:uncharacterized membrane protein YdbT with pleckstrin-like domain